MAIGLLPCVPAAGNSILRTALFVGRIINPSVIASTLSELNNTKIMISTRLLLWAALAGAFIPVMAILNGRLGRAIGEGVHAPVVLFGVSAVFSLACALFFTRSLPDFQTFGNIRPIDYLGGVIVGFYVLSATLLAPRIGVANFIVCAVSAQIIVSVVIDNYGLLGAVVRPVNLTKLFGVGLLIVGLVITQVADAKSRG